MADTIITHTHQVAGYELQDPLGRGGFGQVYRALDKSPFKKEAAIKILVPHPFSDPTDIKQRFLREAEAVNKLAHSGIVKYYNSGFTDQTDIPFLAMEFIQGQSLREACESQSFIGRVEYMTQVLDALEYAHNEGVLHRDIKPSNIMVRKSDSRVVIVDFGLAFLFEGLSSEQFTTHYVGTHGYVPPEVLANFNLRKKTHDVFSCGVTLYEILTGTRPNIQNIQPLTTTSSELAGLDPIIKQSLAREEDRFQSAKQFSDSLKSWLDSAVLKTKVTGSNKIAELARSRLIKQKNEQEKYQQEQLEKKAKQQAVWDEKNSVIFSAAKLAFEEMHAALSDLTEYDYLETQPTNSALTPLLLYKHREYDTKICFGLTKYLNQQMTVTVGNNDYSLLGYQAVQNQPARGIGAQNIASRSREAALRQLPPNGFLLPAWVIYRDSRDSSPKQISYGALAVAQYQEAKLVAREIPRVKGGFALRGSPIELNTAEEIREYISLAIASTLGIDMGE